MKNVSIKLTLFLVAFVLLFYSSCSEDTPTTTEGETVFFNGNIYTVNSAQEWATAMFVKDGVIEYIGDDATAKARAGEGATQVDLKGAFVMPGIHDVHAHPLEASTESFQFIVDENKTNPENYASDVTTAMNANPGTGWLLGWGHHLETVFAATRNPKLILDDVAPNRPVAIMEQTSHSIWCNSAALALMGIDANTTNPQGGIIMRDANGEATGILIDNAGNMLIDLALQSSATSEQNDYQGLIDYGLKELAKYGITSVSDARTYWKRNHHLVWKRIADEGKLTTRVNLGLWAYPTENDASQIAMLKSLYSNEGGSLLKINQVKLYADGIIHNGTAAMNSNYLVDYYGLPTNNGLNYFTESRIADYIAQLESTGFDLHIHALGNRAIHESLNAIQQSGTSSGRHRLTHVEFMDAVDFPRFAQLNVTADAQVAGEFTQPQYWSDNDYLVGSALTQNIIPLRSLADANARITLSSDWDVSDLNPFIGLQNAVTRTPQALTLAEAIRAYTINAAYVMRQENVVGSLETGKEADFIVLNNNPFDVNMNQIKNIKVDETYLRGARVFKR
jgi:predicted amidohydrolase YtcJ